MTGSARRLKNDSSNTVLIVEIGQTDTVNEVFTVMYEGAPKWRPLELFVRRDVLSRHVFKGAPKGSGSVKRF